MNGYYELNKYNLNNNLIIRVRETKRNLITSFMSQWLQLSSKLWLESCTQLQVIHLNEDSDAMINQQEPKQF